MHRTASCSPVQVLRPIQSVRAVQPYLRGNSGISRFTASVRDSTVGTYDRESHNFSGAVVHQRLKPLANAVGATLLLATLGSASLAAESGGNTLRRITAEPAAWQGPVLTAQLVPPAARDSVAPNPVSPTVNQPLPNPAPAEIVTPSSTPKQYESPLLDGKLPAEELLPPVVTEGSCDEGGGHQGVQPYGGGHPTDWSWGCGGNPYRTGPGLCDN